MLCSRALNTFKLTLALQESPSRSKFLRAVQQASVSGSKRGGELRTAHGSRICDSEGDLDTAMGCAPRLRPWTNVGADASTVSRLHMAYRSVAGKLPEYRDSQPT